MVTVDEIRALDDLDELDRVIVELAVAVRPMLKASTDVEVVDLVYKSPAMRLREQAERYEREDALVFRLRAACDRRRELTAVPA